ncbi:MAG: hypothetical protein A2W66_11265 [Deltaproteobacteria bacterium RIFCSPLOWO2_02_56_12]|nr:MAG: hypothetical protein A2W66_11265 [Deltaproteobacteria bacterium RIFCSPLOWO2_02_56_12]OGQ95074.1 MAG: hypothetical protein A2253_03490 [Deltaproteobacteria bacterium RIFOXYA2_FULL_55_11]HBA39272.1 hypothetical protein [Deltaproteobacteria bacterium]
MDNKGQSQIRGWLRSRTGLVLIGFLAIIGFFLVTEHRAHLLGFLPYLLLLACPLLHWLMHGGHGGPGETHKHSPRGDEE